jgi:Transposase IS4
MERKPEDGMETQNICCAQSGIMYQIKLVKTAEENAATAKWVFLLMFVEFFLLANLTHPLINFFSDEDAAMNHGTKVLVELLRPLANFGRVVVADSYFASVQAALTLFGMGLRFIGTVKTATRGFPMHYLQRCVLPGGKGDHKALLSKDEESGCSLLAMVWADRDRWYFIFTCLSTAPGRTISRRRWQQVDTTPNADPELCLVQIKQTECGEVYYQGCGMIDQHNCHWQDGLDLECSTLVFTHSWLIPDGTRVTWLTSLTNPWCHYDVIRCRFLPERTNDCIQLLVANDSNNQQLD